MRSLII